MKPIIPITIALCMLAAVGCSKKNDAAITTVTPPPTGIDTFDNAVFANLSDTLITMDLYSTADDYNHNTNKAATLTLAGNSSISKVIRNNVVYYVDFYSSSYTYSNWDYNDYNDNTQPQAVQLKLSESSLGFTVQASINNVSQDRQILLKGNQPATSWKIVNAYKKTGNSWVSVLGALPATFKGMSMTFNKYFALNFQDTTGMLQKVAFTHSGSTTALWGDVTNAAGHIGNFSNGSQSPPYTHSFDSLGFQYDNQDVRYVFVRQ